MYSSIDEFGSQCWVLVAPMWKLWFPLEHLLQYHCDHRSNKETPVVCAITASIMNFNPLPIFTCAYYFKIYTKMPVWMIIFILCFARTRFIHWFLCSHGDNKEDIVFREVTPCSLTQRYQYFGGIWLLPLQGRIVIEQVGSNKNCVAACASDLYQLSVFRIHRNHSGKRC